MRMNWWYLDFLLLVYFLLCWKLTFFCESHPLLEFHGTYSEHVLLFFGQLITECHGGNLHADEDGDQVQHKKAEIMSNSIQNTMVITCM